MAPTCPSPGTQNPPNVGYSGAPAGYANGAAGLGGAPCGLVPVAGLGAPTGFWVYQSANGYGVTKVIPVYGPPGDQPPGNGQPIGSGPMPTGPGQSGGYPMNTSPGYPVMAPNNVPSNGPYAGAAPAPTRSATWPGYPQGYGSPSMACPPQGAMPPSYSPNGLAASQVPAGGVPLPVYTGATEPPSYAPQSFGTGQVPTVPNYSPQSAAVPVPQR